MKTVTKNTEYKVLFNGSNTWLLVNFHGDSLGHYDTERKALNAFKKTSHLAGV